MVSRNGGYGLNSTKRHEMNMEEEGEEEHEDFVDFNYFWIWSIVEFVFCFCFWSLSLTDSSFPLPVVFHLSCHMKPRQPLFDTYTFF